MKRVLIVFCTVLLFSGTGVYAELHDRGNGLIYDDVLDVTWLQDANYAATELNDTRVDQIISEVGSIAGHSLTTADFHKNGDIYDGRMTWWGATAWALALEYYDPSRNLTVNGWRLPHTLPVNGINYDYSFSNDGSSDKGYNISAEGTEYFGSTGSEMAYMYYNNLNNLGSVDFEGNTQPGGGLQNTGTFQNLQAFDYWSGTETGTTTTGAWYFSFPSGLQGDDVKSDMVYAWALRDGDVGVQKPKYTVTDLGTLGGRYSTAEAINIHGNVAGYSETASGEKNAFLWTPEVGIVNLGTLGGTISAAYDINDSGVVAGESTTAASPAPHAFLYDSTGMHDLGTLGGDVSIAYGINNIGHVTGESHMTGGNSRAFLYDGNEMHNLGCLGDASCTSGGTNVNDYDQVVGYAVNPVYAFIYDNNEMQIIGTLGGESAIAHDINNSGMVVGTSETTVGSGHAFIFDGNELQDLGTLNGYGSTAWGINNLGEVVGDSGTPSGVGHAFIWDSLDGMRDLNYMIPTDSGWELRTAQDINDVGEIVGYGLIDTNGDGFKEKRAYLLTPIVEAPTYSCAGFKPPCDKIISLKNKNRSIPLRTELLDSEGLPITDADIQSPPKIEVSYESNMPSPSDTTVYNGLPPAEATDGNEFIYEDGEWHLNIKIRDYDEGSGTYTLTMESGDESEYIIDSAYNTVTVVLDK